MKSGNKNWLEPLFIGLILVLPFIVLIPSINSILFPAISDYSDLVISHLPNIIDVRFSLAQYHQIPLWSETILGGYPLISDPLSGIWYPPIWLTWFLPIPITINLLVIFHLYFAEIGMFLFLKRVGFNPIPALLGALLTGLAPKIWGHFGYGHITLVFAYAWTTWLLFFISSKTKPSGIMRIAPGIILACIILADLRWFIYAFALFSAYKIWFTLVPLLREKLLSRFLDLAKEILIQFSTAMFLCLPYLFLVFQYSSFSTRSLMTISDQLALSLPAEGLFGIFYPDMAGNAEWMIYTGAFTLLVILNLFFSKMDRESGFWMFVFIFSIIFAMGIRPISDYLFKIPGMNLLRVPSRSLLISIFAVAAMTAKSCELIINLPKIERIPRPFWFNLLTFGMGVFSMFVMLGMTLFIKGMPIKFVWGTGFYLSFFALLIVRDKQLISGRIFGLIIIPIFVLDLLTVSFSQVKSVDYEKVINEKLNVIQSLMKNNEPYRIYSPSYSIPQQTAANNFLELADGIDPMQLRGYADYMADASGVPDKAYSVTIPPFASGNPGLDNQNSRPDLVLLGKLNVRYIVSEFEMFSLKSSLLKKVGQTYVYTNPEYLPRARIVTPQGQTAIDAIQFRPGKIEFSAPGPGTLVLSEVNYPGWKARIDGKDVEIITYDRIFQAVNLEKGSHQVVFDFEPEPILAVLGSGIVILMGIMGWQIAYSKRN